MHEVLIDKSKQRDAMTWCEQHLGERYSVVDNRAGKWALYWAGRDNFDMYRCCFVDEKDMMWFILRWT